MSMLAKKLLQSVGLIFIDTATSTVNNSCHVFVKSCYVNQVGN